MRLIEQQMNEAISTRANQWAKDNTSVMYIPQLDQSSIYLHGHHIAFYDHTKGTMVPNLDTFRDWPTATTRSRLRALGVNASIKNFEATIDGVVL